jgi:anti-sigma B factor antagonist
MKIKVSEKYDAVIISLKGNVMGGEDTKNFNETLHKLIEEDKKNVIIDVSHVKFMNSSGLGMLIGGLTTVKKAEGRLILAGVTEKIESLLIMLTMLLNNSLLKGITI